MDLRELTNLTRLSEKPKSLEDLREEAEALRLRYRAMLGPNGSSGARSTSKSPPEATEERGDEFVEQATGPSSSSAENPDNPVGAPGDTVPHASSSKMFAASVESLLLTLRHPVHGSEPEAAEESNGKDSVVREEAPPELQHADTLLENPVPKDLSSAPDDTAENETVVSRATSDDAPSSLDTDRVATSSEKSTSVFETALNALRRTIHEAGHLPERLTNGKVSTDRRTDAEPDGIPNSVSEELPKYAPPMDGRICTECGRETELSEERCRNCDRVDRSLGVLAAVIAGDLKKVTQLLQARPEIIGTRTSGHGWSLLHMAASGGNPKMAELLISKDANVDAQTTDGKTPLHYAAGKGHLEVVRVLVAHEADLSAECEGKTVLNFAEERGKDEVTDFLRGCGA